MTTDEAIVQAVYEACEQLDHVPGHNGLWDVLAELTDDAEKE